MLNLRFWPVNTISRHRQEALLCHPSEARLLFKADLVNFSIAQELYQTFWATKHVRLSRMVWNCAERDSKSTEYYAWNIERHTLKAGCISL